MTASYFILSKERTSDITGTGKYYNLWLGSCFLVINWKGYMSTQGISAAIARVDELTSVQGLVLTQSMSSVFQLITPGGAP